MTLTSDAQIVFNDLGLDRDGALVLAKTLGQQILDESESTDTPLECMVYEVWGLYDNNMPACRFLVQSGNDEVVFEGNFRTKEGGALVERQRKVDPETSRAMARDTCSPRSDQ